jgi:hypothetical protein
LHADRTSSTRPASSARVKKLATAGPEVKVTASRLRSATAWITRVAGTVSTGSVQR